MQMQDENTRGAMRRVVWAGDTFVLLSARIFSRFFRSRRAGCRRDITARRVKIDGGYGYEDSDSEVAGVYCARAQKIFQNKQGQKEIKIHGLNGLR